MDDKKEQRGDLSYELPTATFESTQLAECIVTEADDDKIGINKEAMPDIRKHFHDVISLVGSPGVGKSTLGSTIYNILRNDQREYFNASDSMEGSTKGIWTLEKHNTDDTINVLELEGLQDEDIIHYYVVIAMVLSKVMLLCANYNGNPRFRSDMFKALQSGIRVYKANNIRIPSPIIYVQVPMDQSTGKAMTRFKLRKESVNLNGLVRYIKNKYKELEDFEIRVFALPTFDKDRFNQNYVSAVQALITELKSINQGIRIEDRVNYAYGVAAALNNKSPSIIADMNLKFLKTEIKTCADEIKQTTINQLRDDAKLIRMDGMIEFTEFCKLISPDGKYGYGKLVQTQAISSPYYDENNDQQNKIFQEYYLEPKDHCKDIWATEVSSVRSVGSVHGPPIPLSKSLVVIICIEKYNKKQSALDELPGTQTDRERLIQLFSQKYKYDIVANRDPFVTSKDVDYILFQAADKFDTHKNGYQSIMIFFSGHGDEQYLLCSDYNNKTGKGRYKRTEFEQYFNGYQCENKSKEYKFFFVDSCRGQENSLVFDIKSKLGKSKGNQNNESAYTLHPEANKCIMYSNSNTYASYEVPYDEKKQDIDWTKMGDEDEPDKFCGIFMNSIWNIFNQNFNGGCVHTFSKIQDLIREKASSGIVPIKYEQTCKVNLGINESGTLMNSVKQRILFKANVKSLNQQKEVEQDNKTAMRKEKNIEYF